MDKQHVISGICISIISGLAAFFDSTLSYMIALLLGFTFNILAGFRADEVRVKLVRLIPPQFLQNFNGNKLKDSLMELFLITFITYFLKGIIDLMKCQDKSAFVVQFLIAVAIYYYFRNALKNLKKVYPKIKWISMLYNLISFKFRELVGSDVADIIEKEEEK
jgi:hypothetical protein